MSKHIGVGSLSISTGDYCRHYLNVFYKGVDDSKKASVLWNVVNWSNKPEMRWNDNVFVFDRMLGYNTAFYDIRTRDWQWGEVNHKSATCYIKYGNKHFGYIQPIYSDNDDKIVTSDNEIIIPIAKVIPSALVLEGFVKHIIPLYRYLMKKSSSTVSIHPSTNISKEDNEFQIKTNSRIYLPLV